MRFPILKVFFQALKPSSFTSPVSLHVDLSFMKLLFLSQMVLTSVRKALKIYLHNMISMFIKSNIFILGTKNIFRILLNQLSLFYFSDLHRLCFGRGRKNPLWIQGRIQA